MKSNLDDMRVDEAIETYPLKPLPAGFVESVLSQIEPHPKVDPKSISDANTNFLFVVVPVAIVWLGLTASLLVKFSSVWLDPSQASYHRSLVEYWMVQITFSLGEYKQFITLGIGLVVLGGFAALWRVTDPARKLGW
jgi:hypothetical protein